MVYWDLVGPEGPSVQVVQQDLLHPDLQVSHGFPESQLVLLDL